MGRDRGGRSSEKKVPVVSDEDLRDRITTAWTGGGVSVVTKRKRLSPFAVPTLLKIFYLLFSSNKPDGLDIGTRKLERVAVNAGKLPGGFHIRDANGSDGPVNKLQPAQCLHGPVGMDQG